MNLGLSKIKLILNRKIICGFDLCIDAEEKRSCVNKSVNYVISANSNSNWIITLRI